MPRSKVRPARMHGRVDAGSSSLWKYASSVPRKNSLVSPATGEGCAETLAMSCSRHRTYSFSDAVAAVATVDCVRPVGPPWVSRGPAPGYGQFGQGDRDEGVWSGPTPDVVPAPYAARRLVGGAARTRRQPERAQTLTP